MRGRVATVVQLRWSWLVLTTASVAYSKTDIRLQFTALESALKFSTGGIERHPEYEAAMLRERVRGSIAYAEFIQ